MSKLRLNEARGRWWRGRFTFRHRKLREYLAKVKNNKQHFPSHRRALKAAEAGVTKWGKLEGEAAREVHKYAAAVARERPKPRPPVVHGEGLSTPQASFNPYRRPIANWIIPILVWAANPGDGGERWTGVVVSGWRSRAAQWIAAVKYGLWHYANNNPFNSNHLTYIFPGGAVDVTEYEQLHRVLKRYPGSRKLLWAGLTIGDLVHYSSNGH